MKPETSRRAMLGALAALPAAATMAKAETAAVCLPGGPADPLSGIFAERQRVHALVNGGHYASEDEADALMDIWSACDAQATASPATTIAGAAVSIEWARRELMEFGFNPRRPDNGTRLVLALFDGALGVLRAQGTDFSKAEFSA